MICSAHELVRDGVLGKGGPWTLRDLVPGVVGGH